MITTPLLSWLFFAAFLKPIPVESQSDGSRACIPAGTTIYSAADAGVKGPKLQSEVAFGERPPKVSFPVVFEVLINSAGRICDVHIINAPDREAAFRVGRYVGDHFRFTPASLKGKPIAARLTLVLDQRGRVTLPK